MEKQDSKKINLKFGLKMCILILITTLLGGAGMFGLAKHRQHVSYEATRSVIISHDIHPVSNSGNGNGSYSSSDIDMMTTYKKLSEDPTIAKAARKKLPSSIRKKYSADDIADMVSAHVSQQSLLMELNVKAGNKKDAVKIVNAVATGMKEELPKIQPGAGTVRLLAPATQSSTEMEKTLHTKKYVIVGCALGALVGLIIFFVITTWTKLV